MSRYLKRFRNVSEINSGETYPCPACIWVDNPESGMTTANWGFDDDEYKIRVDGNKIEAIREGASNKIYYKSKNNILLWPYDAANDRNIGINEGASIFGVNIISHISGGCSGYNEITFDDPVTMVGEQAFNGWHIGNREREDLLEIYFPKTVTEYKNWCVEWHKNLSKLKINDEATTCGVVSFYDNESLTEFDIPTSLNSLGYGLVADCLLLKRLNGTHTGITEDRRSFVLNNELQIVAPAGLKEYTIPDNARVIRAYTFHYCNNLKQVTIHSGVTTIGGGAFQYCSGLEKIVLEGAPPSLESIDALENTNNCPIYVPAASLNAYKTATNWSTYSDRILPVVRNNQIVYTSSDGKKITPYATGTSIFGAEILFNTYFMGVGIITFDGDVTKIGEKAFFESGRLTSVYIPNSVTSIGNEAFSKCSGLTCTMIPNSVTSLGNYSFARCGSLSAFGGTYTGITSDRRCLCDGSTLNSFAPNGLTSYSIPNSITAIGNGVFQYCNSLTSVTIPNSVTSIGRYALYRSSFLELTIPDSVKWVDEWCCAANESLTSVTIGSGITSLSRDMFKQCSSLSQVSIPKSSIQILGFECFRQTGLYSISIPAGVTTIEKNAFALCENLDSVSIPSTVIYIGDSAFYDCSSLSIVACKPTTPPTLADSNAFYGNDSDRIIKVPVNSVNAYKAATNWSSLSSSIVSE